MSTDATVRLGRYEILEEIGRGAMGVVYLAQDPLIGRRVALKVFRVGFSTTDDELRNLYACFIREAQSAGILSHPNIVTVHDVAQAEGENPAFIAMEYVSGQTLKNVLEAPEPISIERALNLALQVVAALDYAHAIGVVHRDIKPGNILVTAEDAVKITDFGIAQVNVGNTTNHGQLLGTPNYMAPEAIEEQDVDHRADLFSLGVVLYELLTRHKPFSGKNMTKITHRIVYEPFTPPREYVADLPVELEVVLGRLLEKDPAQRYQTAAQVGRALEAACEGNPVLVDTNSFQVPGEAAEESATSEVPAGVENHSPGASRARPAVLGRLLGKLRQRTPLANLPVWVVAAGVLLGLPALYMLSTAVGSGVAEPALATPVGVQQASRSASVVSPPVSALEPLIGRLDALEQQARRLELAGDLEGAHAALVEAVRIDPASNRLRNHLLRVGNRLQLELSIAASEVEDQLAAARRSLQDGRFRDAVAFADRAWLLDPMNLEAPDLIRTAEGGLARLRARREAARVEVVQVAEMVEPEPAVEPAPPPPVEVKRPAPPLATTGTLVLALTAARSPGVITLYEGESQVFSERFKFVPEKKRAKGFFKRSLNSIGSLTAKGIEGQLSRQMIHDPGNIDLRVYVSLPGEVTQVLPVGGYLQAGEAITLNIDIRSDGRASAAFE